LREITEYLFVLWHLAHAQPAAADVRERQDIDSMVFNDYRHYGGRLAFSAGGEGDRYGCCTDRR
jgi:hypothetical protein